MSTTVNKGLDKTVSVELKQSAEAFDKMRPYGERRIDARDLMSLLAELRVTMATVNAVPSQSVLQGDLDGEQAAEADLVEEEEEEVEEEEVWSDGDEDVDEILEDEEDSDVDDE